jgi:hypothetical protein
MTKDTLTQRPSDTITLAEAQDALLRSGYLLEARLETLIRREAYYVQANHSFPDPDTRKSRELDLYAMTTFKVGPDDADRIFPVLLIECVNNPQPLVFITKEPQTAFLFHEDIKHAGLPVKFRIKGGKWESLPWYLELNKFHHYCKGRVATQFCSFRRKKDQQNREWMALHEDAQFDCFRKLTEATDHFVDEHFKTWRFGGREFINIEFFYPVLVLEGKLFEALPTRSSVRLVHRQHIQFRRSQFTGGTVKDYQIDVIEESFMPKYLQLVHEEGKAIARRLRRHRKEVRRAIEVIVGAARRLRSPEKIRKAFEYSA